MPARHPAHSLPRRLRTASLLLGGLLAGAASFAQGAPVVIGAEDDWLPYAGVIDGAPAGLAVDLVREAFAAGGVPLELRALPYSRCLALTEAGQLAACFNTSRDASLEERFLWHAKPLFEARILIYGRAPPARALGVPDLLDRHVATTNGYTYGDAVDLERRIVRHPASNDLAALRMLSAGRVDYALVFEAVAGHLAGLHPELAGRVHAAGHVQTMPVYVSCSRTHPDGKRACETLSRGLAALEAAGQADRIRARWLPPASETLQEPAP